MADTTSGLDSLAVPEDTNIVGGAKPVAAKGPYAMASSTGATGYDPELLSNMQKLIEEKQAQRESFLERMKDAQAWWSGGVAGPAEALQNRALEKDRQQAELFGMKSQLSQAKMGQAQLDQLRKQDAASGWGAPSSAADPGTPVTAGAIPADIVKQYNTILATEGVTAANKFKNAVLQQGYKSQAEFQNNPAAYNLTVEYKVQNPNTGAWSIEKMSPLDAQRRGVSEAQRVTPAPAPTSAPSSVVNTGGANLGNMRPAGQSTGFQPNVGPAEDLSRIDNNLKSYGDKGVNTLAGVISRWAPPNENDTPVLVANAAKFLGIDPNQKIDLQNPAVRQAISTAIIKQEGNLPKVFGVGTSQTPTTSDIAQSQAISQAGGVSQATEAGKLYAAGENTLRSQGLSAGTRQVTQDATMKLLDDPELKTMVGKYQTGSKADAFVRQMQAGIEAGNFGSIGLKELQENLAKSGASPEAIRKFAQLESFMKQNELEWSTNYLKGQGAVSDNERGLVQKAVGSVNDPIGKLKTLTATMRERALFDAEVYNAYKKNKGVNFGDFLDSDQFQALNDKHNNRLANVLGMNPADLKSNQGFNIKNNVAETPSVTTKAQYDALPKGAVYLENGKPFRKP